MRLLLLCLALTGCSAPTEPVVRRSADLTMAWDSTMERKKPVDWFPCAMREVGSVVWVDGMKYWEILYVCY